MKKLSKLGIAFLALVGLSACATNTVKITSVPTAENEFYLASDELVRGYDAIVRYHPDFVTANTPKANPLDLELRWGPPQQVNTSSKPKYMLGFLSGAAIILTAPHTAIIVPLLGLSYGNYLAQKEEVLIWDKGDYQINATVKRKFGNSVMTSWKWNYKALDYLSPILSSHLKKQSPRVRLMYGQDMRQYQTKTRLNKLDGTAIQLGVRSQVYHFNPSLSVATAFSWRSTQHKQTKTQDKIEWVRFPAEFGLRYTLHAYEQVNIEAGFSYHLQGQYDIGESDSLKVSNGNGFYFESGIKINSNYALGLRMEWMQHGTESHQTINANHVSTYIELLI
ncbi:MAG: hypothetical protein OEZ58_05095 [Gammaproteobacteria bacterium]|nr:hypothetical protein [Gammaproteobacteria bacterium]